MSARHWVDRRARFARHFHALAQSGGIDAAGALIVPDNQQAGSTTPLDVRACARPTLIVPGLLGLSLRSLVAPMVCARQALGPQGYAIDVAWVSGRANCSRNAAMLRERVLRRADEAGEAVTVVGYSKGCADALHMLGEYPETHEATFALASLGGVVWGTPLAARTPRWLRWVLQNAPIPGERRGDADALHDLTRERRTDWLHEHPLPESLRYASIVGTPARGDVSRILRGTYRQLARIDALNDSQVIMEDAILPGSELLATVSADHWALALPIEQSQPLLSRLMVNRNAFPRALLLHALIDYLNAVPE